ncbi:hypothetical protein [Prolixibacter sp. NT017]|uniref:hypothetical protein n=1 Tax=Prolixibacter sp. NT017 TaxID=2652390 RepID=UPI001271D097|nr:hypothetical protein [Prolixibacter sp. NT017]GET24783.1 hypothetical protein NT017_11120 [Prolixibacter sp. NT017]
MKTQVSFFLTILLVGMMSCQKDDKSAANAGIHFTKNEKVSDVIVSYDEIVGYDSTRYIFQVTPTAWNRLKKEISPSYPDPHFAFGVALHQQLIYSAKYVPGYYSSSQRDVITFLLVEPDLIYLKLGYPSSPGLFTGEDSRNDSRLIGQLKKDDKLTEIGN